MTKPPRTKRPTGRKKKPFYQPEDTAQINYLEDLGDPGRYPFTRGVHSEMYRTRLWTMRQYAGYGTAEESNRRYRYLLSQGTTGLSVAFDLPTQIGLDSDHPQAAGEVGRVGVAIDSLEDMQRLFEGIPLEGISTSMTINATSATLTWLLPRDEGFHGQACGVLFRMTFSRSTLLAAPTFILRSLPSGLSRISFLFASAKFLSGTPSQSAATISERRVRQQLRSSLSL